MPAPTRAQIEAPVTLPEYLVEYNAGAGWVAVSASWLIDVRGATETGSGDNGIAFGTDVSANFEVILDPQASSIAWDGTQVRVSFGFGGSSKVVAATGTITERSRQDDGSLTWSCRGFAETVSNTAIWSPLFYRRPVATETTASSAEDPSNSAYQAGLINFIFWKAGGRPYEQSASYPNATFYYDCEPALLAPEWSWIAGEDAWSELQRLAKAAGGQIYQTPAGVMTYINPLSFGGSGAYAFTEATFESISEKLSRADKVGTVQCSYTGRRLQPEQVVYEDKTPRMIEAGGTLQVNLDMQQPVFDYVLAVGGATLPADAYVSSTFDGQALPLGTSITLNSATRLGILFTNTQLGPMVLSRIAIRGRPIAPVEEGIATYGSGQPEKEIGSDTGVYVQHRGHATRLCRMYHSYMSTARPIYTLSGCGFDPDRYVGEAVVLSYAAWSLSSLPCRIVAIRHSDTGATMEVDLVSTSGLPGTASFFIIGQSYADSDIRQLSY